MPIVVILFTGEHSSHFIHKANEVGPQSTKGVGFRHKGGWCPGCKVTILQPNRVGSWSWPCDFVHW
jgi:hypothetical protein